MLQGVIWRYTFWRHISSSLILIIDSKNSSSFIDDNLTDLIFGMMHGVFSSCIVVKIARFYHDFLLLYHIKTWTSPFLLFSLPLACTIPSVPVVCAWRSNWSVMSCTFLHQCNMKKKQTETSPRPSTPEKCLYVVTFPCLFSLSGSSSIPGHCGSMKVQGQNPDMRSNRIPTSCIIAWSKQSFCQLSKVSNQNYIKKGQGWHPHSLCLFSFPWSSPIPGWCSLP